MTFTYDVIVIGGGVIGASAAASASKHFKTALLEQEAVLGYHASGRSAAILLPSYGGPSARALTAASRQFLCSPPDEFCVSSLTSPRGALFLAAPGRTQMLANWATPGDDRSRDLKLLSAAEAVERVPILRPSEIAGALDIPQVVDIDAASLLQSFVRVFKANGGALFVNAKAASITHTTNEWLVETQAGSFRARVLINAAGAWADEIAGLAGVAPKGLVSKRRTMFVISGPDAVDVSRWPIVADVDETFYFKPDAGRLAVSPADRTIVQPGDALPEEIDVATGIERFEIATTMTVRHVKHSWAGLRTFAPDEEPIIGFDTDAPDFMWMAGFGGFGVQASIGAGFCCEALLLEGCLPIRLQDYGVELQQLSPRRLGGATSK